MAARSKELKLATRMTERVSPVLAQLEQCDARMTVAVKEHMPPFQVLDMSSHL